MGIQNQSSHLCLQRWKVWWRQKNPKPIEMLTKHFWGTREDLGLHYWLEIPFKIKNTKSEKPSLPSKDGRSVEGRETWNQLNVAGVSVWGLIEGGPPALSQASDQSLKGRQYLTWVFLAVVSAGGRLVCWSRERDLRVWFTKDLLWVRRSWDFCPLWAWQAMEGFQSAGLTSRNVVESCLCYRVRGSEYSEQRPGRLDEK